MLQQLSDRNRQRLKTVVTILATALVIAPAAALATGGFNDVQESDFFSDAVGWMKDNGVTVGCNPPANTNYCPDQSVTRGEMAVFFERLDSKNVFLRPGEAPDGSGGDAETLDGKDSTDFLLDDETAVDSDKLDGKDSSDLVAKTELLWALVDLDSGGATVDINNGATGASRDGTGSFTVTFNRDITGCVIQATPADVTGFDAPTGYFVGVDHEGTDGVEVRTTADDGTATDPAGTDGVSLTVVC